jgi:hypothetical protein
LAETDIGAAAEILNRRRRRHVADPGMAAGALGAAGRGVDDALIPAIGRGRCERRQLLGDTAVDREGTRTAGKVAIARQRVLPVAGPGAAQPAVAGFDRDHHLQRAARRHVVEGQRQRRSALGGRHFSGLHPAYAAAVLYDDLIAVAQRRPHRRGRFARQPMTGIRAHAHRHGEGAAEIHRHRGRGPEYLDAGLDQLRRVADRGDGAQALADERHAIGNFILGYPAGDLPHGGPQRRFHQHASDDAAERREDLGAGAEFDAAGEQAEHDARPEPDYDHSLRPFQHVGEPGAVRAENAGGKEQRRKTEIEDAGQYGAGDRDRAAPVRSSHAAESEPRRTCRFRPGERQRRRGIGKRHAHQHELGRYRLQIFDGVGLEQAEIPAKPGLPADRGDDVAGRIEKLDIGAHASLDRIGHVDRKGAAVAADRVRIDRQAPALRQVRHRQAPVDASGSYLPAQRATRGAVGAAVDDRPAMRDRPALVAQLRIVIGGIERGDHRRAHRGHGVVAERVLFDLIAGLVRAKVILEHVRLVGAGIDRYFDGLPGGRILLDVDGELDQRGPIDAGIDMGFDLRGGWHEGGAELRMLHDQMDRGVDRRADQVGVGHELSVARGRHWREAQIVQFCGMGGFGAAQRLAPRLVPEPRGNPGSDPGHRAQPKTLVAVIVTHFEGAYPPWRKRARGRIGVVGDPGRTLLRAHHADDSISARGIAQAFAVVTTDRKLLQPNVKSEIVERVIEMRQIKVMSDDVRRRHVEPATDWLGEGWRESEGERA